MKKPYYIDFPQEPFEGQAHKYRCVYCKEETTTINGKLAGHLASCEYRLKLEQAGYEALGCSTKPASTAADDFD